MLNYIRPALIEATTETAMMNRRCLYTVERHGKPPETFKSFAHRLSVDMGLMAQLGYRLLDVVFPQGFGGHSVESMLVNILELPTHGRFGETEVIITPDDDAPRVSFRSACTENGNF